MTHSLAELQVEDDSAVPQQRTAEQTRDTDEATAESGPTGQGRTAAQGSVAVAGLVFGTRGEAKDGQDPASSEPVSGKPAAAKGSAPSRLTVPGDIEFEWTRWEAFGFPPEVKAAQDEYSKTMIWLAFLGANLVPTMPDELRPALVANLNATEGMLLALARKPIAVADRFEAIRAITMWSKAIETTVDTARRERDAVLAVQARLAAELKATNEMVERLEAEEAARVEVEAEARRVAEALQRQLKEAADRAAAEKLALEQAKAEAERVAQEEVDRKRLEAEKQAQEEADRKRAEVQAAREKEEQAKQERDRLEAIEQEKKSRRALFGDNQPAFDAALAAATRIADAELAQTILALEATRDEAEDVARKAAKTTTKKGPHRRPAPTRKSMVSEPTTTAAAVEPVKPAHQSAFEEGEGRAVAAHGASVATRVDKYGALASSSKGAGLAPEDLEWAIATSSGSVPVADALVNLCARGPDGVAVAREIATRPDIVGHAALCVTLLNAGTSVADVAKGAVLLHGLNSTSVTWVMGVLGPKTSVTDALSFLERHKEHKLAMLIGARCGVGYANDDLIATVISTKSTPSAVTWLASSAPLDFALLAKAINSRNLKVDDVQAVVEPFVPGFALTAVLEIVTTFPQQILNIPAMLANAPPGLPQMVTMRLRLGAADTLNPFTLAAMTTEAQLMAGLGAVVTCTRDDVFYVGSSDRQAHNEKAGARTGFLNLPRLGATYELHVHWENKGTMELTSMHVQINRVNGTELNQIMNFFPKMIAAAVAALNRHGLAEGGTVKAPKGR